MTKQINDRPAGLAFSGFDLEPPWNWQRFNILGGAVEAKLGPQTGLRKFHIIKGH